MVRRIILSSLMLVTLIFSGCGDSEGEDRLNVQQMLDNGDYNGVISTLEGGATTNENNLLLGSAYLNKSGLSLSALVGIITDGADSKDGAFATFIDGVSKRRTSTALLDLEKSTSYYKAVIGTKCKDANDNNLVLSDTQKDICLLMGLSETMKAATTISYISDDVSALGSNSNVVDPKLQTSACAMQYAFDGDSTSIDPTKCSVLVVGDYKFASGLTYEKVEITYVPDNSKKFNYLLAGNSTPRSTIITDGYCSLDSFSPRAKDKNSLDYEITFHECPINEDPNAIDITTGKVLVDALNNGTDSIGIAASDDMKNDVDEFKCEVLSGVYNENTIACDGADLTKSVTTLDVITYLNNNNK